MAGRATHWPKVIIIGLDGGTLDLIRPWAKRGELPNLQSLMRSGVSGPLTSTVPPITPVAWSAFLTGQPPERHGVYDFVERLPQSYRTRVTHANSRRCPSFWQTLSAAGLVVGALHTPFTYPPERVRGFMVSGFDAPRLDRSAVSPPEAMDCIADLCRGYVHGSLPMRPRATYADRAGEKARRLVAMALRLQSRWPCDVLMITASSTDHVQHHFWPEGQAADQVVRAGGEILATYRSVDAAIGELLSAVRGPETTVLVMSDHGAGPLMGHVNQTRVLAEAGLLRLRGAAAGSRSARASVRAVRGIRRLFRSGLAKPLKPLALRLMPESAKARVAETELDAIDWSRTRAFAWGTYGKVQVNLAGREPEGCVQPGSDYKAVLADVEQAFLSLRDPRTDEPVIEGCIRTAEQRGAPPTDGAPDLLLIPRGYAYDPGPHLGHSDLPLVFGPSEAPAPLSTLTAMHRMDGCLIVSDPKAATGELPCHDLQGLRRVILQYAGVECPADPADAHAPASGSGYSAEEEALVEARLRDLGYL
ncbi:MAG TPA: alkaline phosphatase family protein [Armatimonadota bacterium]|nr:alkaline phosphatase family protein [Armatimonadota bacterium]